MRSGREGIFVDLAANAPAGVVEQRTVDERHLEINPDAERNQRVRHNRNEAHVNRPYGDPGLLNRPIL